MFRLAFLGDASFRVGVPELQDGAVFGDVEVTFPFQPSGQLQGLRVGDSFGSDVGFATDPAARDFCFEFGKRFGPIVVDPQDRTGDGAIGGAADRRLSRFIEDIACPEVTWEVDAVVRDQAWIHDRFPVLGPGADVFDRGTDPMVELVVDRRFAIHAAEVGGDHGRVWGDAVACGPEEDPIDEERRLAFVVTQHFGECRPSGGEEEFIDIDKGDPAACAANPAEAMVIGLLLCAEFGPIGNANDTATGPRFDDALPVIGAIVVVEEKVGHPELEMEFDPFVEVVRFVFKDRTDRDLVFEVLLFVGQECRSSLVPADRGF